jgi:hypothetical protein
MTKSLLCARFNSGICSQKVHVYLQDSKIARDFTNFPNVTACNNNKKKPTVGWFSEKIQQTSVIPILIVYLTNQRPEKVYWSRAAPSKIIIIINPWTTIMPGLFAIRYEQIQSKINDHDGSRASPPMPVGNSYGTVKAPETIF